MLAVGVDDQDAVAGRVADAGLDRRAVAFVVRMPNDARAGRRLRARRCRRSSRRRRRGSRATRAAARSVGDDRGRSAAASLNAGMTTESSDSGAAISISVPMRGYVAKRKLMMSPSCTMYSLPSSRTSPWSRQAAIEPRAISAS